MLDTEMLQETGHQFKPDRDSLFQGDIGRLAHPGSKDAFESKSQ